MSLEDVEALLIRKAMARYGNVTHAARALGLSRSALYRRLERYKLVTRESPRPPGGCCSGARRRPARRSIARPGPACGCEPPFFMAARARRVAARGRPGAWASALSMLAREQLARPLQTISNLAGGAARRRLLYPRPRAARADDALGHVMFEINTLAETLRSQRLGAQEATALLRAVMAEIDVAIFAFDSAQRLALVNRYGERLLGRARRRAGGPRRRRAGLCSRCSIAPSACAT